MEGGEYARLVRKIIGLSKPTLLLVDPLYASRLAALGGAIPVGLYPELPLPTSFEPSLLGPGEPVFVQFSSGSTSDPHGCVLSAGAIAWQLAALERALGLDAVGDVLAMWLPIAHDMGLVGGVLLAYWIGHRLLLSTPWRFLQQPHSWFTDCEAFGVTTSAAPNFALDLAARTAPILPQGGSPMRRMIVGGEPVIPATLRRACAALGHGRLPARALMPAYGLAEAVLAVTMTAPGRGATIVNVEQEALGKGVVSRVDHADATRKEVIREVAGVGRALPGSVVDVPGEASVGEIRIQSPSLAGGYLEAQDLTRSRFSKDGYLTGDLGFILDGELFVTGRSDDLMCLLGRNVYGQDIETALVRVDGVNPGGCVVVDVESAKLVAVVEPKQGHRSLEVMAEEMATAARSGAGVQLDECIFVPPGYLPKTPSGKTQRFRCRALAADANTHSAIRITL